MRHRKAGRKLNRNATHRLALKRNLALALFRHERIITTVEKAKELRPFVEKLITLARKGTLHARRLVIAKLGPMAKAEVHPPEKDDDPEEDLRPILVKLFSDIAPRYGDRPGGYTRIIKRHECRLGDGGKTAFIELLKAGETKPVKKAAPAPTPAPKVETPPPAPEPTSPPAHTATETPSAPETAAAPETPATTPSETPQAPPTA
jgi:large subunit ribosomal protein L17